MKSPRLAQEVLVPVRIGLLRTAIQALDAKARTDSGHSYGDSLFRPEDTMDWQTARAIEAHIRAFADSAAEWQTEKK